ncbi:MAG: hypothetical protein ACI4PW_09665 [Alphaproteobacteria bacterium]
MEDEQRGVMARIRSLFGYACALFLASVYTFLLALLCFSASFLITYGTSKSTFYSIFLFIKAAFVRPMLIVEAYLQWFGRLSSYDGSFLAVAWLPAIPLIAFPLFTFFGLSALSRARKAAERYSRSFEEESEENAAPRRKPQDMMEELTEAFEELQEKLSQLRGHKKDSDETDEKTSSAVEEINYQTLYVDDKVHLYGKSVENPEWKGRVRLTVIRCPKSMASGFLVKGLCDGSAAKRTARKLEGYYRDMTDEEGSAEIQKLHAGTLDLHPYAAIEKWEEISESWAPVKVLFCLVLT